MTIISHPSLLVKRILLGAVIALAMISFFIIQVKHPDPGWGTLWVIRPLVVVTLAGAAGGAFFYFLMDRLGSRGGWKKALAITLSLLIYVVGLWMGTVLGLAGTLWN